MDDITETHLGHGTELLDEVASLTGLPEDMVQKELQQILSASGHNAEELTLDGLRASMLKYLETMIDEIPSEEEEVLDAVLDSAQPSKLPN